MENIGMDNNFLVLLLYYCIVIHTNVFHLICTSDFYMPLKEHIPDGQLMDSNQKTVAYIKLGRLACLHDSEDFPSQSCCVVIPHTYCISGMPRSVQLDH